MSGLDIDTRGDIYSLGVLLYELLVGQTPFDAKEMMQGGLDALRQIIREKEPLRPSTKLNTLQGDARTTAGKRRQTDVGKLVHQLQGDLDWIVMKCLEKDRTRRYETANGLARGHPAASEQRTGRRPSAERGLPVPESWCGGTSWPSPPAQCRGAGVDRWSGFRRTWHACASAGAAPKPAALERATAKAKPSAQQAEKQQRQRADAEKLDRRSAISMWPT